MYTYQWKSLVSHLGALSQPHVLYMVVMQSTTAMACAFYACLENRNELDRFYISLSIETESIARRYGACFHFRVSVILSAGINEHQKQHKHTMSN